MTSKKPPAWQVFPKDLMSDEKVILMSWEERGIYFWLLCHSWLERGIPADPATRAKLLGISPAKERKVWKAIGPCWSPGDAPDRLVQLKQEEKRAELDEFLGSRSKAGKKGARVRWGGAVAIVLAMAIGCSLAMAVPCVCHSSRIALPLAHRWPASASASPATDQLAGCRATSSSPPSRPRTSPTAVQPASGGATASGRRVR